MATGTARLFRCVLKVLCSIHGSRSEATTNCDDLLGHFLIEVPALADRTQQAQADEQAE